MLTTGRKLVLLTFFLPIGAEAQTTPLKERLPEKTLFYMLWRGSAHRDKVRATNPLLRLAVDPEFRSVQLKWMEQAFLTSGTPLPPTIRASIGATTGDMLMGWTEAEGASPQVSDPLAFAAAFASRYFLVLHNVQKLDFTAILEETRKLPSRSKTEVTTERRAGREVTRFQIENMPFYTTVLGEYVIQTGSLKLLDEMVARMESATPPTNSLTQTAFWKEMHRSIEPSASMEMGFRFPELLLENFPLPPPTAGFNASQMLKALHFSRFHGLAAALYFSGDSTRLRLSLLGDTSPGSLFDLFASGRESFATISAAPPGTQWFTAGRIDLPALYNLVRSVALAATPAGQGEGTAPAVEATVEKALGMPIQEALNLFTGEVASTATDFTGDPLTQTYALAIKNPESVLRIVRAILGNDLTNEEVSGPTTFLTYASSYVDEKTKAQRKRFYTIGVAPGIVVMAQRKAVVRETINRMSASGENTLAGTEKFSSGRQRLPQDLTGILYSDLSQVQWDKVLAELTQSMKDAEKRTQESREKNSTNPLKSEPQQSASEILRSFPPALLTKYLHILVAGWWKDSTGLHYDGYVY